MAFYMTAESSAEFNSRRNILVKVSGDLIDRDEFYDWFKSIISKAVNVVIICGGGSAISEELDRRGISYYFGPAGRKIASLEGIALAYQVLVKQKEIVEEKLRAKGINCQVDMPVVEIGDMKCLVNGDDYAMTLYPNFDRVYIATLQGRIKKIPNGYARAEIVSF